MYELYVNSICGVVHTRQCFSVTSRIGTVLPTQNREMRLSLSKQSPWCLCPLGLHTKAALIGANNINVDDSVLEKKQTGHPVSSTLVLCGIEHILWRHVFLVRIPEKH
ncbi:hypothetical protein RF11_06161 [Thelohanellus kitauei]|uniref:Uncharacterized protein n=1 Tax=Thelohanellus kitauei TaxID=669202 RepID=A0A0C2NDH4_THEKT|nr:hypothetical protein RF11_06161 [Thelohanellus kitauei]